MLINIPPSLINFGVLANGFMTSEEKKQTHKGDIIRAAKKTQKNRAAMDGNCGKTVSLYLLISSSFTSILVSLVHCKSGRYWVASLNHITYETIDKYNINFDYLPRSWGTWKNKSIVEA